MGDFAQEGLYPRNQPIFFDSDSYTQPCPEEQKYPEVLEDQDSINISITSYINNDGDYGSNSSIGSSKKERRDFVVSKKEDKVIDTDKPTEERMLTTHFDKVKKRYYAYDHKRKRSFWL